MSNDAPESKDAALTPEMEAEMEALRAEVFQHMARLADKLGSVEPLRAALMQSFSLIGDAALRKQYDDLRVELDAFLRARAGGGEAKVEKPEGFVESPEVEEGELRALAYVLTMAAEDESEEA